MIGGKLIEYQNELKWYTFIISFTEKKRENVYSPN